MADPAGKRIAARLFCITTHAVRSQFFPSLRQLANDLHRNKPPEFRYEREKTSYFVSADGIMGYVSLARDISLLREVDGHVEPFCGAAKPIWTGFETALNEYAVNYLKQLGFDRENTLEQCTTMLKMDPPDIPTWRKIQEKLGIHISETKFNRLLSLEGVKYEIGYQLVTKQVFLPAGATI